MTQFLRAYFDRAATGDAPDAPIVFTASNEGVMSDGADLRMEQWSLERFRKHNVILYSHAYGGDILPIGTGEPFFEDRRLMMRVRFDVDDPFAMRVRDKTLKGMMGASVGWSTIKRDGQALNELLEMSVCPIPLDQNALPVFGARALALATEYAELTDDELLDAAAEATGEPDESQAEEARLAGERAAADFDQGLRLLDIQLRITEVQLK